MKKVVSATLAGALAVGMVPAMALADDSVELLAQTDTEAINNGFISAWAQGATLTTTEFAKGDAAIASIIPTAVQEVAPGTTNYDVVEFAWVKVDAAADASDANSGSWTVGGKPFKALSMSGADIAWTYGTTAANLPDEVGNYVMIAKADGDADGDGVIESGEVATYCYDGFAFSIVPAAVKGELAVYDTDAIVPSATIVYDGTNQYFGSYDLGIYADGEALDPATYTVLECYCADTKLKRTDFAAAGDYIAEVEFTAGNSASVVKMVPFTIQKLDLSKAVITLDKTIMQKGSAAPVVTYVNGSAYSDLSDFVTVTETSEILTATGTAVGNYTMTVGLTAAGKANANIIDSSKIIDIDLVTNSVTPGIAYAGSDMDTAADGVQINRSAIAYKATDEFDASKLAVTSGNKTFKAAEYDLVVEKLVPVDANISKWVAADVADLTNVNTYGNFRVKAVLDCDELKHTYGGESAWMYVDITNGTLVAADVTFAYAGKNIDADDLQVPGVTYTGKDVLDGIAVQVKTAAGVVAADAYDVVVTKEITKADGTKKWEVVTDGIVDAGKYYISVTSGKYAVDPNAGIFVTVNPVNVKAYRADQIQTTKDGKFAANEFLYTGETVNPVEFFAVSNGQGTFLDKAGAAIAEKADCVVVDVPASAYKVNITQFIPEGETTPVLKKDLPTEFVEPGEYTYTIVDAAPGKDNYTIDPTTVDKKLVITSMDVFPDVASDAWYADEVLVAAQNGWIGGYANGLYGPNDGMKRGDLALVLYRYLDKTTQSNSGSIAGEDDEYVNTGFADVNGKMYYAEAVKAMAEAGIITGYADGTYGAEDLVTRQMYATILARLEASGLGDASILASALDAYADADEVAGWAAEGVEWAVENGIMGVDTAYLNPGDTITRAEAAAMLVRYDAL